MFQQLHRNSQKRFYHKGMVYFIVNKTNNNFPYFKEPIFCQLLIKELKLCKKIKGFKLYGFSLIYDHLNLLIKPNNEYNISKIMKSLKENTSRDINNIMFNRSAEGDTSTCRLQLRCYIEKSKAQFIEKYGVNQTEFPPFKWQRSFHDHYIRNKNDFQHHLNYTAYNHFKHHLPENWKFNNFGYPKLIDD